MNINKGGFMNQSEVIELQNLARKIRCHCLDMVKIGKSGHIGSMLSMPELLVVLYEKILNVDPKNPDMPERDRFILSKGHGGAALFAVLAEMGFFPLEWLKRYYVDDGILHGHISHHIPGVELSTGSLGHGLPVACGMAMAARNQNKKHRVFCLMSDGDCNAGSTWEAIMLAGQHKFDNLIGIVDYNRLQALGRSEDIINLEPFKEKMELFGWAVKVIDGHSITEIYEAFKTLPLEKGKPTWIIANTIKGKGVKKFENEFRCHYGVTDEDIETGIKNLMEA
jgi:transketolase